MNPTTPPALATLTQVPVPPAPLVIDVDDPIVPSSLPQQTPSRPPPAVSLRTATESDVIFLDDRDEAEKAQAAVSDKIVLEYLRRRGYRRAEQALLNHDLGTAAANATALTKVDLAVDEAQVDDDLRNVVMMLGRPSDLADSDAKRFEDSYCELRDWVDNSLDLYKAELHTVLYPFLVHCFLEIVRREHLQEARAFLQRCSAEFAEGAATADGFTGRREELQSLAGIASQQHLEENETAKLFMNNRYEIQLSSYAFELIVSFLSDDKRRHVLLRILNQRCRVLLDADVDVPTRAAAAQGGTATDKTGFVPASEKSGLLREDVLWGRLRPEHYMIPDEGEVPAGKKGGKGGVGEKGKLGAAEGKGKSDVTKRDGTGDEDEEPVTREDGTITESKIPLKKYRYGAQGMETAADRKNQASLSSAAVAEGTRSELTILCYTFTNTKGDGLNCSAVSEDGSLVVAGFGDSTVRIWDAKASGTSGSGAGGLGGRPVRLVGHGGPVYSVEWTRCSRFVLSGSEDGTVRLWNASLKTDVAAYRGHNYPVWSVGMAPLGHYFASGSHDRTARVWCTERVTPLRILAGHLADVDSLRWHPNCNYVATGSSDRTARLWDVRDGKCVRVFGAQGGTVHALAFSPDGRTVACGGDGKAIEIWDVAMGTRVTRLMEHKSTVWALDYSREGAVLSSGGADNAVCAWDAGDWSQIIEANEENGGMFGNGNGEGNGDGSNGIANGNAEGIGGSPEGEAGSGKGKEGGGEGGSGMEGVTANGGDGNKVKAVTGIGSKRKRRAVGESALIARFDTKDTPVHSLRFTRRNLLIALGSFAT